MTEQRTAKPDLSRLTLNKERTPAPRAGLIRAAAVGAVLAAAALGIALFSGAGEPRASSTAASVSVQERAASAPAGGGQLFATGYVVARRQAAVSSKATGRLKELRVTEGDRVKQGEILGIIENGDLEAQVREREANLTALQRRVEAARAELAEAERVMRRSEKLISGRVISQSDFDEAMTRHLKASADFASAEAESMLGAAQLERAKVDLEYSFIRAPFDGTVLTKDADIGEIVAPFGASADARAAIVTIADMGSLEIEADVSEAQISRVRPGQAVTIVLDSYPEKEYRGTVHNIVPTVDRAKATVLTRISFLERDEHVIPEMSARVTFSESRP